MADAVIMRGRDMIMAEGAKTFAGPYTTPGHPEILVSAFRVLRHSQRDIKLHYATVRLVQRFW